MRATYGSTFYYPLSNVTWPNLRYCKMSLCIFRYKNKFYGIDTTAQSFGRSSYLKNFPRFYVRSFSFISFLFISIYGYRAYVDCMFFNTFAEAKFWLHEEKKKGFLRGDQAPIYRMWLISNRTCGELFTFSIDARLKTYSITKTSSIYNKLGTYFLGKLALAQDPPT